VKTINATVQERNKSQQNYYCLKDCLSGLRSPSLPNLEKFEFVKKQWFMLNVFGEKRVLVQTLHLAKTGI